MDPQIIQFFKRWQEKEGKYPDLDIEKVEFDTPEIGEIVSYLKKGKTPKYSPNNEKTDCVVIKSGQARGGDNKFDFSKIAYLRHDLINPEDERNLKRGDLLVNSTGVGTAGRVTRFDMEGCYVADSHIIILRFDSEKHDSKYILKYFQSFGFKRLELMAEGTGGQIELSQSVIKNIKIPIPKDLNSEYDSLLLQNIIVEFLDYRLGLTQATRNQVDSIREKVELMDKIMLPKIFEMKDPWLRGQFNKWAELKGYDIRVDDLVFEKEKLTDVATITSGQSPTGKDLNSEHKGIPFYQGKTEFTDKYIGEPRRWTTKSKKLAHKNDILFSMRAPAGAVNIATQTISIGRGLSAITPKRNYDTNYLFNFFKMKEKTIDYENDKGGFYSSITQNELALIEVYIPQPSKQYSSYQIQQMLVEFYSAFERFRDKLFGHIDRVHQKVDRLDEVTIAKTFKRNK